MPTQLPLQNEAEFKCGPSPCWWSPLGRGASGAPPLPILAPALVEAVTWPELGAGFGHQALTDCVRDGGVSW